MKDSDKFDWISLYIRLLSREKGYTVSIYHRIAKLKEYYDKDARVVELEDMPVLEAGSVRSEGSTPSPGTKENFTNEI